MIPVSFPEANTKFSAVGCGDLPAFSEGATIVSCWQPNEEERKRIADGGNVWLLIQGAGQPPVSLTTEFPFADKGECWPDEVAELEEVTDRR